MADLHKQLITPKMILRECLRLVYNNSEISARENCNLAPKFKCGKTYSVVSCLNPEYLRYSKLDVISGALAEILQFSIETSDDSLTRLPELTIGKINNLHESFNGIEINANFGEGVATQLLWFSLVIKL